MSEESVQDDIKLPEAIEKCLAGFDPKLRDDPQVLKMIQDAIEEAKAAKTNAFKAKTKAFKAVDEAKADDEALPKKKFRNKKALNRRLVFRKNKSVPI